MRILLIHQAFAAIDEPGGTRHYEFAQYFASHGHQITIVTTPINYLTGKEQNQGGVERIQVGMGEIVIWRRRVYGAFHRSFVHRTISFISFMLTSFWAAMKVEQPDLIWGTSPPIFQGVTAWAVSRLRRKPFLLEIRDLWPAFAVQVGVLRNPILIRLSEWLERFLIQRADTVVVNSPGFMDHVRQRGAKKIECVPNGADVNLFEAKKDGNAFRRKYGLEGKFVVLYAGAHGMSNDLGTLLRSAQLVQSQKEIVFVLVGDGKEKPALMQQAEQMGLKNVLFLPPIAKTEISNVFQAADACVALLKPIPLYGTVYPNKVFDYMAAGKPVILAIAGVIKQVVEEEKAGIAVPPGDAPAMAAAVLQLAGNPMLAAECGQNGRRAILERFDRQKLANQFERLLLKMVEKD
ncbi:MAG: glycosyltransferase family 4 protein [Chloroflexota bacterium]